MAKAPRSSDSASSSGSVRRVLSVEDYVQGVKARDRAILGRAITLTESQKPEDRKLAQELLVEILPLSGKSRRIGISGVPGVGKSTFIEAFGKFLTSQGHHVAVLAVDPTSSITGGSILGDKTRMQQLSVDPHAFIRPSPSAGTLGGVAQRTREAMLLCEAAGFDVVLVETVGVGQSETVVADMVDAFLVLMLPGAGDELQGIKRGILEVADLIAINKCDGDNQVRAELAQRELQSAFKILRKPVEGQTQEKSWVPPVLRVSALKKTGLDELWKSFNSFFESLESHGGLNHKRHQQMVRWMWDLVESRLIQELKTEPKVQSLSKKLESEVMAGKTTPALAAQTILEAFLKALKS